MVVNEYLKQIIDTIFRLDFFCLFLIRTLRKIYTTSSSSGKMSVQDALLRKIKNARQ